MHILLLTETLTAGGAETFVVRLANALAADNQVMIAVMHGHRDHPAVAARIDRQVRVERFVQPGIRWLFKADSALRKAGIDIPVIHIQQHRWLRRLCGQFVPHVIHSHLLKADRLGSEISAQIPGCRHVITMHGDYQPFLFGQADPQLLHLEKQVCRILERSDAIACISRQQVDFLGGRYPGTAGKLHLIYNGYSLPPSRGITRQELGLPDGKLLFGMVARGIRQKGWQEAIDAFASLDAADRAALVLVGEGPFLDDLASRPRPDGVIFTGFSANPTDLIRHFEIGLLPSYYPAESLPTVIIEYLACGKPVIATDVGEIRTMITTPTGKMAGRLVALKADGLATEDLAKAMTVMLHDDDERLRLAASARSAAAQFGMNRCLDSYLVLYRGSASTSSINENH